MVKFLGFFITAFFIVGCTAFQVEKPTREVGDNLGIPQMWTRAGQGNDGRIAEGWLASFKDPDMTRLVAEAMEHNNNLQVAAARLRQAREGTIIGRAARLPSISASGSGSRSGSRFQETDGDLSAWEQSTNYGLSLNASWELDLWGRLRDIEEASIQDYIGEEAIFRGARLSLAANTAKAWCNLITTGMLVGSARETREMFMRDFAIKERDYIAGNGSALEVKFGRNNVASAEQQLLARQLNQEDSARSLEVLVGRYPSATISHGTELPDLPRAVPAGLPAELLMRRPDLVAARANLLASASRADAARKSLLPSINLSGRGSTSSDELIDLIADPQSIAWNVAASLAQTVFRGGAPTAAARQSLERNRAAIEAFADVALRAFQEVESALATERSLAQQEIHLRTELETAISAERQAESEFLAGLPTTPLQILEAQRRVISARNSTILFQNQRLQNRIDLHLALGGDFETPAPAPESEIRS